MAVDLAFDGQEALRLTGREGYDVVVLDRDLPKLHGDHVQVAPLVKLGAIWYSRARAPNNQTQTEA
jgi:hypothetical protein